MKDSRVARFALYVSAAAAVFSAGCGNSSQSSALSMTSIPDNARNGTVVLPTRGGSSAFVSVEQYTALHPDHRKSWVSRDAKRDRVLLFASDSGLAEVDIYALPNLKLEGQLTGFNEPQGMCADSKGDVYVADTNNTVVDEYSHAGLLVATYPDNYGLPVGCAVDPATGDLAATDVVNSGSGPRQVQIFTSPSSSRILTNPDQYFYYFAGFGPHSQLWVSGRDASGVYVLSRCGASSCSTISLSGGTLYFPGAVQWDKARRTWVVFDQLCGNAPAACSYPVSPRGVLGTATTYNNYRGAASAT